MSKVKQVICIRKDLGMRKGKIAAQCSHASMKVFFDRMKVIICGEDIRGNRHIDKCDNCDYLYGCKNEEKYNPKTCTHFSPLISITCNFTHEMVEWMEGSFTKVVVQLKDLDELFGIHTKAEEFNIPHAIIEDSGATEFKEECPICKGEGVVWVTVNENVIESCQCLNCHSSGKINKPTITCIALGPASSDVLDPITGHLKLF